MSAERLRTLAVLLIVLIGLGTAGSQEPADGRTYIVLYNGTTVRDAVLQGNVEIETCYGKFTIPAGDVRRIEFGFRIPEQQKVLLDNALKNLASNNFQEREAAARDLAALGRLAYPALTLLAKAKKDLDTTKRIDTILEEIRRKVPSSNLRTVEEDIVRTENMVFRGRITMPTLKASVGVLGPLQLPLAHIRELRSAGGFGSVTLKPSGDDSWIDTEVDLSAGSSFIVKVTGSINIELNGVAIAAGPDGNQQLRALVNARVPHSVTLPVGLVQGKIGSGAPFPVGSNHQGKAAQDGRLHLRIYTGGPHMLPFNGSYQAEVELN